MNAEEVISHPWFWIAFTAAAHLFVRAVLWATGRLSTALLQPLLQQEAVPTDLVDCGPSFQESLQLIRDMHRAKFVREYKPIE